MNEAAQWFITASGIAGLLYWAHAAGRAIAARIEAGESREPHEHR